MHLSRAALSLFTLFLNKLGMSWQIIMLSWRRCFLLSGKSHRVAAAALLKTKRLYFNEKFSHRDIVEMSQHQILRTVDAFKGASLKVILR
jgi:hypothetical protein